MRLVLQPPRWWWLAIAHEHERRREAAQTLRLATECDVPMYGLGDEWQGSREARIGFCHASFRRGWLGLRLQDGPLIVDELRAYHEAEGKTLIVTSHREGEEVDTARLVNNFLSISWVIDQRQPASTESEDDERAPSRSRPASSTLDRDWRAFEVRVDGAPARFQRLSMAGHWLALGTMNDHLVSIEGHGVVAEDLRLSRVTNPSAWVSRPCPATTGRTIVELGDRLGDLLGLP